jgi:hypothetical protein
MRTLRRIFTTLCTLALSACVEQGLTNTPARDELTLTPASATATSATVGFGFLAPTVRVPSIPGGTFDGTRTPTVRISCVLATGPTCPTVRTLIMGAGASDIRVNASTAEYRVTWTTPSSLEIGSGRYRIEVLDGATVLGSAPARVSITTRDAALAADNEIAIVRGKSIVITFRITTITADALAGDPASPAVAAVPDLVAPLTDNDFNTNHPVLLGIPLSFNTALVRLRATATVGEANALIAQAEGVLIGGSRGIAGRVPALLVLRFATTTHAQMDAKLAALRIAPIVLGAVAEMRMTDHALPRSAGQTVPASWNWDLRPAIGGNWAIKTARVPQTWNLNRFVQRVGGDVRTGVWELGAVEPHNDLPFVNALTPAVAVDSHAVYVAGVISARHGNGGIDGVSPFIELFSAGGVRNELTTNDAVAQLRQWTNANVRVVNASFGASWASDVAGFSTTAASVFMNVLGDIVADAFTRLSEEGLTLPIVVASAGNNSTSTLAFPAILDGPLQNAALQRGIAPIIVVEATARTTESGARPLEQRVRRAEFSNVGGHLSAGGEAIMTTDLSNDFIDAINGTSFSAPLVAGAISYLYSLHPTLPAPTLTSNPLKALLLLDAVTVPDGAPSIDLFAAALNADQVVGGTRALDALLDIDDGSFDGNQRVNPKTGAETVVDSVGGDGRVSMRDFRRWRDWQLDADAIAARSLNGSATHPARDLNLDGTVSTDMDIENVYPRGDFNGDGRISASRTRQMPTAIGGAPKTDLEVLQVRFADSVYTSADLPTLLTSSDIEVRTDACIGASGAVRTITRILKPNGALHKEVTQIGTSAVRQIFTVPEDVGRYVVNVEAFSVTGTSLGRDSDTLPVQTPGADVLVESACATLVVSASGASSATVGIATPVQVLVRRVDALTGVSTPVANAAVTVSVVNGSVVPTSGATGSNGTFSTSATGLQAGVMTVRFSVQSQGQILTAEHSLTVSGGVAIPAAGLSLQIVSGFLAGTPTSPIRYRARVTSIPNATITWTATASSNGQGFLPAGPQQALISSFTIEAPVDVDAFRVDVFANLTYLPNTRLARGITINTRACVFVNGVQVLQPSGQPLCATISSFFP